ncbi:NUDIX domain-containing protein [Actinomyces radicidentis]|uniref:NUDIX domain-containing protein n=1 Tax=Actinomyces radicidentis TaxID=111015 RepID=UPI000A054130
MRPDTTLVPELAVTDLAASLIFWRDLIGFTVSYDRPEEGFAYLVHGDAHLMLDQIGLGRTWRTGPFEAPLGRGINLQLAVDHLDTILQRLDGADVGLFMEAEERWYAVGPEQEAGVRQALVQDPDGYLLRLQEGLGFRAPGKAVEVAVAAIVDDGRILLVHRRPGRASYPDCWDLPGGHLEPGESPEDAVRRKCREELGITLDGVDPLALPGSDPALVKHAFAAVSWRGTPTNTAPDEHDGLAWFTADDLDALTLADHADLAPLRGLLGSQPHVDD